MKYQVLVPMAGADSFFDPKDYFFPKPLIDVGDKSMIQWFVESFAFTVEVDRFIFVINASDQAVFSLKSIIENLTSIPCEFVEAKHPTKGAVCSCLLASDLLDKEKPLVVTNFDQVVDEDIQSLLNGFVSEECGAAVLTFGSSHPRWSYVELEAEQVVHAVEKRVISKEAIAGFYYYKTAGSFLDWCGSVLLKKDHHDGLYYLSATLNQCLLSGNTVSRRRISSGNYHTLYSPSKVNEFELLLRERSMSTSEEPSLKILVPAAGKGSRFAKAGYKTPKPFIDVNGKAMILQVMENLNVDNASFLLVVRDEHHEYVDGLGKDLDELSANVSTLDIETEGTACTVLAARHSLSAVDELLVANSDQIIDMDIADFVSDARERDLDGSILVFKEESLDPKWSYAKLDNNGLVDRVKEKEAISDLATVGIYYFKTFDAYRDAALEMILRQDRVNGEYYTCPVYNYMIDKDMRVGVYEIEKEQMHGIGTPEDLKAYLDKL